MSSFYGRTWKKGFLRRLIPAAKSFPVVTNRKEYYLFVSTHEKNQSNPDIKVTIKKRLAR